MSTDDERRVASLTEIRRVLAARDMCSHGVLKRHCTVHRRVEQVEPEPPTEGEAG